MQKCIRQSIHHTGQSLLEFGLVLPIFVLMLIGATSMALGMYEAHMASDAVRHVMLSKLVMADKPQAVSAGEVMGIISQTPLKGSLPTQGNYVDNVTIVDAGEETAIIVGTKNYKAMSSWVPDLTIKVTQPINKALLEPAANGGTARPMGTAWVPGGAPVPPPWSEAGLALMMAEVGAMSEADLAQFMSMLPPETLADVLQQAEAANAAQAAEQTTEQTTEL